jgi:RNA polymerase primary sigma factor
MKVKDDKEIKCKNILNAYCETLKNFPPLTKEEERYLLKRYKEDNDISARQKLITSNLRYALKFVISYNNKKNVPIEDLIEEANIGLIKAVDEFNLSNENRIISYANWKMLFSLQEATKDDIQKTNGVDEFIDNISESEDNLDDNIEYIGIDEYLDFENYDDEYESPESDYYVEELYENDGIIFSQKTLIKTLLSELNERECDMISMYYGVNNYKKEHTLNEIGEKYNITKERVRQIIEKCKRKMRIKALVENQIYA